MRMRRCVRIVFKEVISKRRELIVRTAAGVALACLLAAACSCSSRARRGAGDAGRDVPAQASAQKADAARAGGSGFELVNFTGAALRAVYVSPSDSKGWEENVLGADELRDGSAALIRFDPRENASLWDVRVEAGEGRFAEWKGLDLRGASRVTLLLKLIGQPVAVAEVE